MKIDGDSGVSMSAEARRAAAHAEKRPQLFLSYARADAELINKLSEHIQANGWNTWVDRMSIPSASEWMAEIRRGIESADGFVFVLTPHSLASRMCRVELSIAVELSKRLLPCCPLSKSDWAAAERKILEAQSYAAVADHVPPELQQLDYIDINDFLQRANPLEELVIELLIAASRDLQWLRQHTGLQQDVKRWLEGRYSIAALLRGALLAEAEAMLAATDKDPPVTALQREFVEASRAEFEKYLRREAAQLAHRILDLPKERVALGVMLALQGLGTYTHTPELIGALRTLLSRWRQRAIIRHDAYLITAAFSHDGRVAFTASADGSLRLMDVRTGDFTRYTCGQNVELTAAALTQDAKLAVAACGDGSVHLFDFHREKSIKLQLSDEPITDVAISPAGSKVCAAVGSVPTIIDPVDGDTYRLPGHADSISTVAFVTEAGIVTTGKDGTVRLFDLDTRKWEEFAVPLGEIQSVCVGPDRTWVALIGAFEGVVIMNTQTRVTHSLELPGGSGGLVMALSGDGNRLAVADIWGRVLVLDPLNGEVMANKHLFETYPWSLKLNAEGSLLCGASSSGVALVCDLSSGKDWVCAGHDGPVRTINLASNDAMLLTGGADKTARIFTVGGFPYTQTFPHASAPLTAEISLDGRLLVTAARDGVTRTFNLQTGLPLVEFQGPQAALHSALFTKQRELVVAYGDGAIVFVDAESGTALRSFASTPLEMHSQVRMTNDQRWLVTLLFHEIIHVFSPENGSTAELSELEIARIALDIQMQMGWINPHGWMVSAEGGHAPSLKRDGTEINLRAREYQVIDAAFSPEGSVLVGATLNRTELPLFDSATGELIASLDLAHKSNKARFSADGTHIVASSLDAVSVIHYPNAADLVKRAESQIHRELTAGERAEFGLPVR